MCDSKATLQSSLNTHKEAFHEKNKYYCKMRDNQSGGKHDLSSHKRSKHSSSTSSNLN